MTRIPREAVMSAMRRLKIQRVLIAEETLDVWKGGMLRTGMVELMRFPLMEKWDVWLMSCMRRILVSSSGCCWRLLYDSIINAVTTAENKPACPD